MKKIVIPIVLFILISTVGFAQVENKNAPKFKFNHEIHDFGTIDEGVQVTYEFEFKNTGKEPLIIQNVKASCGCTTPHWPREPILPGQSGQVKAVYNSKGRPGAFNKAITITSNATEPTKVVYIKGNVKKKPAEQTQPLKEPSLLREAN